MARRSDVRHAFNDALVLQPTWRIIITTRDFVRCLERYNHHWSLQDANAWIARYQSFFKDITDHEREDKSYYLVNMGYVQ